MAGDLPKVRLVPAEPRPAEPSPPLDRPLSLEEAFRQYAPYVARVCMRVGGPKADVDDLVQDVFLAAHERLAGLRHPQAIVAWLGMVAVRIARRRLRRQRLLAFLGLDDAADEDLVDPAISAADGVVLKQVYRVLSRRSADEQLAWTLRHVEGESLERVALLCGCSLATAKRRITSAQRALEEAFQDG